ncbi:hypothetical protein GOODEAATRI_027182, partial [Goodea atripinnis]
PTSYLCLCLTGGAVSVCPGMRNDGRLCSRGENLPTVPGALCPGDEDASAGERPGADAPLVGPGV